MLNKYYNTTSYQQHYNTSIETETCDDDSDEYCLHMDWSAFKQYARTK